MGAAGTGEFEINPVIATESGVMAVDARYLPATHASHGGHDGGHDGVHGEPADLGPHSEPTDFGPLFEPRAVAVVGASTTRPNFGNMFLEFYKAAGILRSHSEAREVGGVPAVPSLAVADVDYALVAVPAERCAQVVREASGSPP